MPAADLLSAAFLGVIEGLTEFIPVSSTGHLLIAERLIGFHDPGSVFTVVIQLGAILAVMVLLRARIAGVVRGLATGEPQARAFTACVVVATLPGVLVGIPIDSFVEANIMTGAVAPAVVAATFAIGGLAILLIERRGAAPRITDATGLTWRIALAIGCFQLLAAAFPGVSRSGATIMGALLLGVSRPVAAEFSFFLAMPAMAGGSVLKLWKHRDALDPGRLDQIAVGFVVSFIVAWVVVRWLMAFVSTSTFTVFGWYRIAAGLAIAVLIVLGLV